MKVKKCQKSPFRTKIEAHRAGYNEGVLVTNSRWGSKVRELEFKLKTLEDSRGMKDLEIRSQMAQGLSVVADSIAKIAVPGVF